MVVEGTTYCHIFMFQLQINKSILCNFVLSFFTCSTWLIPGELSSYESRLSRPVYILTYLYTYIFTLPEDFWRRLFRWPLVTIATCLQIIAEKETSWLGNRGRRHISFWEPVSNIQIPRLSLYNRLKNFSSIHSKFKFV